MGGLSIFNASAVQNLSVVEQYQYKTARVLPH